MSVLLAGRAYGFGNKAVGLSALLLLFVSLAPVRAEWHQQQRDIMGTRVSLELWHPESSVAEDCSETAFAEMRRIEALMSTYQASSEISFITDNAAVSAVEISDEMAQIVEESLYFSEISNGAFDITYASVGYAYDYRNRQQPSDESVAAKLPAIDYRHIELEKNRIRFRQHGVRIDLGGIAKGYAVDRAIDIVEGCGIFQAMVSAGGDSRIIGDHGVRGYSASSIRVSPRRSRCACRSAKARFPPLATTSGFLSRTANACITS